MFHYQNGVKTQLSNFTSELWDVKDDIVIWSENSFIYSFSNKVKVNVCNYMPEDYLLKNNVFAFRNIMGGVSAFVDGKVIDISYQKDATYEIYGNSVIVQLFNSSFIVLKNGIKYNS